MKSSIFRLLGLRIGRGAKIAFGSKIFGNGSVLIGDNCWIGHEVRFYLGIGSTIEIRENCDIAPRVVFHSGTHQRGDRLRRAGVGAAEDITIGAGTWIGVNATILPGVRIGSGSVIGAGSLVLRGLYSPDSLIVGNSAKVKRSLE